MPDPEFGQPIEQWDRYWSFGSLHSFSQVAGGNYEGAIAEFWRARFATLRNGMRVVDIATGNGAVPLLALEVADRAGIEIRVDGIDLADIEPASRVRDPATRKALGRIRFHGRAPAEKLPIADAAVDRICSQFGLEYSKLSESVGEIARVSAAGAEVALVMHHRDSALLQAADTELRQLTFVLDDARLWQHARNLLRAAAEANGKDRKKVARKRAALDQALQRIHAQARETANSRMLLGPTNYIHEILGAVGRLSWTRLFDMLEESRQRLLANSQRLRDMQAAARSEDDMEDLQGMLEDQGFVMFMREPLLEHDGSLLGWALCARRA